MYQLKKNIFKWVFLVFSLVGIFLVLSSKNLLVIWIGLELNLIRVLPLIIRSSGVVFKYSKNPLLVIYLVVQGIGTSLFCLGCLNPYILRIGLFGLFLKLGSFPLLIWFPNFVSSLNWGLFFLFCRFQKVKKLYLLSIVLNFSKWIVFWLILLSCLFSVFGLYNSTKNIKLMIAWSSILHTKYTVFLLSQDLKLGSIYFIFSTLNIGLICASFSLLNLKSEVSIKEYDKLLVFFSVLNIIGVPIGGGFLMKIAFFCSLNTNTFVILWIFFGFSLCFLTQIICYIRYLKNLSKFFRYGSFSNSKFFYKMVNFSLIILWLIFSFRFLF